MPLSASMSTSARTPKEGVVVISAEGSVIRIASETPQQTLGDLLSLFEVKPSLKEALLSISITFDPQRAYVSCCTEYYDVKIMTCEGQIWLHIIDNEHRESSARQVIKFIEKFFSLKLPKDDKFALLKKREKFTLKYFYNWEEN